MSAPAQPTAIDLAVFPAALAVLAVAWFFVVRRRSLSAAPDRSGVVGPKLAVVGWTLMAARLLMTVVPEEAWKDTPAFLVTPMKAMADMAFMGAMVMFGASLLIKAPESFVRLGLRGRATPWARRVGLWGIPLSLLVVQGFSNAGMYLWCRIGQSMPEVGHETFERLKTSSGAQVWLELLGAVVAAPLIEEAVFRGFLQTGAQSWMGPTARSRWVAILLTAATFGLVHVGAVPVANVPCLVVFGVLLGWAYEATGCFWVSVAMHAGFNAISFALGFWQVRQ